MLENLPLALGCLVALVTAFGVVLARRPVHGAIALLGHSLALAGLYALLGAELVALAQLLIYAGAIVVLFLFVVALLPSGGAEAPSSLARIGSALIGGGAILLGLAVGIGAAAPGTAATAGASVADIGRALFDPRRLLIPFELTAPLLLVAIVGAVTIWRRQEGEAERGLAGRIVRGPAIRGISEMLRPRPSAEPREPVEAGR
jgi:NADH-quinone oxidoreductase subunit J